MALFLRMALYFADAFLAGQGIVVFDQDAGTITFRIEDLVLAISGGTAFLVTFAASRVAKAKGGVT